LPDSQNPGDKKPGLTADFLRTDRALPVLLLLALLGFGLYLTMEQRVFPSASIDLKLNKSQIAVLSRQYADRFGYGHIDGDEDKTSGSNEDKSGKEKKNDAKKSGQEKSKPETKSNSQINNGSQVNNKSQIEKDTSAPVSTTDGGGATNNKPETHLESGDIPTGVSKPPPSTPAPGWSKLEDHGNLSDTAKAEAYANANANAAKVPAPQGNGKANGKAAAAKEVIESTTFVSSDDSKTFLEYQLGAVRANQLMKDEIPVWNWTTRYCKEFDLEQCRVWLSPQGKLTAFQLTFEDERRLPSLSHNQAIKLASDFVLREGGVDVSKLKLVADKSTTMAHRDDHSFTWEDQSQDFKGAKIRYYLYVAGNRVTTYSKILHVPDKWLHQYANMRSYNDLLEQVASLFYLPLQYLAYLAVPLALSRRLMRFRVALFGGLLMALVAGIDSVNDYSSVVDAYNPTISFRDYISSYYMRRALGFVGTFISGACLFGGADVVYRLSYPKRVALENFLNFKGFRTAEGIKALLVGHCVFAVHLGWVIAYYLLGDKIGFWCPLSIDAYQILGSSFPFFSAISLGVHAAFQEETVARVVALSLMQKLTGRFWIANLFQAASWGFMHSSYAQQPSYARGIELTIGGLFYGWILRRYGVLPCIIGHYLVDAFLDVKPLFSAQSMPLYMSAFLPLLPFVSILLVTLIALRSGKPAIDESAVSNESLPVAEPHPKIVAPEAPLVYLPLAKKSRLLLVAVATAGLCFAIWSHTPSPGDGARLTCTVDQAESKARAVMVANGLDPKQYVAVPRLTARLASDQLQYIFEKVGRARTMQLAALTEPGYIWQIRFFKVRDPREYTVELRGDGREYSFGINELDETPGKKLTSDEAKNKAVDYMHRVHPEYKDLVADKVSLDARPERNDWTVDFSVPSLKVGDADYRASIVLIGDKVGGFDTHWVIPDKWVQERAKRTTKDVVLGIARNAMTLALAVFILIWIGRVLRQGHLHWKTAIGISLICGVIIFVEQLNHWPVFFRDYATDKDMQTYLVQQVLELLQSSSVTALTSFLYVAFAIAAYQILKPGTSIANLFKTVIRPSDWPSKLVQEDLWLDGIIVALTWEGLLQSKESILDWLYYWFSPELGTAHLWTICSLPDFIAPVASDLIELFSSFVNSASFYLVAGGILYHYAPRFRKFLLLVIVYQLIQASGARHLSDYFIGAGGDIVDKIITWFVIVRLARFNPVVYITKIVLDDSLPFLDAIHTYAWPCFAPMFISFAFYLVIPFLILLYVHTRNRPKRRLANAASAVAPAPVSAGPAAAVPSAPESRPDDGSAARESASKLPQSPGPEPGAEPDASSDVK
jgi:hypothetical protein